MKTQGHGHLDGGMEGPGLSFTQLLLCEDDPLPGSTGGLPSSGGSNRRPPPVARQVCTLCRCTPESLMDIERQDWLLSIWSLAGLR